MLSLLLSPSMKRLRSKLVDVLRSTRSISLSFRLSQHSKNLFFDLGSATIQNLKYRDVWVLIGQKGINGFSPFEEVRSCREK